MREKGERRRPVWHSWLMYERAVGVGGGGRRSIKWNSEKKKPQQTAFNLLTMQQTGPDVKLLCEEQGPLPLITPLCEQAKSLMDGRFSPKLLSCSTPNT